MMCDCSGDPRDWRSPKPVVLLISQIRLIANYMVYVDDVSLAVTARTCMGSRLKYKGSRVEFYPDQCCEPLPPIARKTLEGAPSSPKKTFNVNRFQMLASMGGEEEEVDW
jgi:hypothetical protein